MFEIKNQRIPFRLQILNLNLFYHTFRSKSETATDLCFILPSLQTSRLPFMVISNVLFRQLYQESNRGEFDFVCKGITNN